MNHVKLGLLLLVGGCTAAPVDGLLAKPLPLTDPDNRGGWVLNDAVSDEFNAETLDAAKWHVQGTGGKYNNDFVGRAPSQFTPGNVSIGDGVFTIHTRWEPDFAFSEKVKDGVKYENITTGALITNAEFRYGYMEIRCHAADGPISSSFWAIGGSGELDVFEHWGHSARNPESGRRMHTSFHDWRDPKSPTWAKRIWTNDHGLDFRVAEGFHTYGLEWDPGFIKIFVDGRMIRRVTREEIGDAWVVDGDMKVWLDCEVFPWEVAGKDLKASDYPGAGRKYVVDYVRVWQHEKPGARDAGPVPVNLLVNPGFEPGAAAWDLAGGARVSADGGLDGGAAVRLSGKGTASQTVAVKPGTTYVVAAEVCLPGTDGKGRWENAWLGVKGYGGDEIRKKFFHADYHRGSLQFTTGPDTASVTVFFTNQQTGHGALADGFELLEAPYLGVADDR